MSNVNPAFMAPFLVMIVLLLILNSKGKKKYSAYVNALDKSVSLRDFLPIGFQIMEMTRYSYGFGVDRRLRRGLSELYEQEYMEFYLRVTWAQTATYTFVGILISTLFFGASNGDLSLLLVGLTISAALATVPFREIDKKLKERHQRVSIDLPNLINQIIILSGAGLTIRAALIKIAKELPSEGPLYEALDRAVLQLENGATNEKALDTLVVSCNTPAIRRVTSVLLQNIHRGGTDVLLALRDIGREQWDARKNAARQIAEETTSKLLFPMLLMLLAVILLVVAPAIMSMNI